MLYFTQPDHFWYLNISLISKVYVLMPILLTLSKFRRLMMDHQVPSSLFGDFINFPILCNKTKPNQSLSRR